MRIARSVSTLLIVATLGCTGGTATRVSGSGGAGGMSSAGSGGAGTSSGGMSSAGSGGAGTSSGGMSSAGSGGAGTSRGGTSGNSGRGGVSGTAGGFLGGAGGHADTNGRGGAGSGGTAGAGGGGAAGSAVTSMPKPGMTWQWQLSGTLDTTVDAQIYDLDLFGTTASTIAALHQAGRIVICYFSAGSYEPDRPDSTALAATGLGQTLDGWPDEKWLDIRTTGVRTIMQARLDLAKSRGCDGVEPDNVDGYANTNGLGLTKADQLDYNTFIAAQGHTRGLSVGLKNALDLVATLVSKFDWALNEECLKYNECSALAPFVTANKAVLHCEYATTKTGICDKAPAGFSTIIKDLDLDAWRLTCP